MLSPQGFSFLAAVAVAALVCALLYSNPNRIARSIAASGIFLLIAIGIRPGVIGESLGAVGVIASLPVLAPLFTRETRQATIDKAPMILFAGLMLWPILWGRSGANFVNSITASLVGAIVYLAGLLVSSRENGLKSVLWAIKGYLYWQGLGYLFTVTFPQIFPFSLNSVFDGRPGWNYYINWLGVSVTGSDQIWDRLLGSQSFGLLQLPRLTGLFGEPAITAIMAAFLAAISFGVKNKVSLFDQLIVPLVLFATQSASGTILWILVWAIYLLNRVTDASERSFSRSLGLLAIIPVLIFAPSVANSLISSKATLSVTDRFAFGDLGTYLGFMWANPLGTRTLENISTVNLMNSGIVLGLPYLLIGIYLYLAWPAIKLQGRSKWMQLSVIFGAVFFAEPATLPLWMLFLGVSVASGKAVQPKGLPLSDAASSPIRTAG